MAFRVMRNKRNQRWTQRLHEIFQEWDKNQTGYISLETMTEIYRIYKVDIKVDDVRPKMDKNGNIKKNEFIELALEAKLLDISERKTPTAENSQSKNTRGSRKVDEFNDQGLFCCLPKKRKTKSDEDARFKSSVDRVEAAFTKFDTDGNGYIDWEEFKEVAKNLEPEQAKRIFETCDSSGDRQISLAEFRMMANLKTEEK